MSDKNLKQKVFGSRSAPSLGSKIVMAVFITAVFLVSIATIAGFWTDRDSQKIDDTTFQAVFLNNGQVYFGRLSDINDRYVVLTNVYYLQNKTADQAEVGAATKDEAAKDDKNQLQLNKLGNEVHGPQAQMFIVRENISFWENLKTDSKVIEAINNQNKSQ